MARDYAKSANQRGRPRNPPARNWRWPLAGILILLFVLAIFYLKQQSDRAARENNESSGMVQSVLQTTTTQTKPVAPAKVKLAAPTQANTSTTTPALPQPKFDFYTELPKEQTVVKVAKPITTAPTPVRELMPTTTPASQVQQPPVNSTAAAAQPADTSAIEETQPKSNTIDTADLTAVELKKLSDNPSNSVNKTTPATPYLVQLGVFRNYAAVDQLKAQLIMQGFNVNVKALKKSSGLYRVYLGPFATLSAAKQQQALLDKNQIKNKLVKELP